MEFDSNTIFKLLEITDNNKDSILEGDYLKICNMLKQMHKLVPTPRPTQTSIMIQVPLTVPRPIPKLPILHETGELESLNEYVKSLKNYRMRNRILQRDKAKVLFEMIEEEDIQEPTSALNLLSNPTTYIIDAVMLLQGTDSWDQFKDLLYRERDRRFLLEKKLIKYEILFANERIEEIKSCLNSA